MVFAAASEALAKDDDDWFMWLEARAAYETVIKLEIKLAVRAKMGVERCNEQIDRIHPDTNE